MEQLRCKHHAAPGRERIEVARRRGSVEGRNPKPSKGAYVRLKQGPMRMRVHSPLKACSAAACDCGSADDLRQLPYRAPRPERAACGHAAELTATAVKHWDATKPTTRDDVSSVG